MFSSESAANNNMNKVSNLFLSNPASFKTEDNYFQQTEQNHHHHHNNNQHQSTGLARYRSAPSSFLAALLDNDNNSSGDEAEALMFSSFFNGSNTNSTSAENPHMNQKNHGTNQDGDDNGNASHHHLPVNGGMKQGRVENHHQMGPYESAVNGGGGAVVGSYNLGMMSDVHLRMDNNNNNGTGNNSSNNLVRQSSSPAGLFSGFSVMGDAGSYRVQNHAESISSANRLGNHSNFSSSPRTSYMPSIPENGNETVITRRTDDLQLRNGHSSSNNGEISSGFARDYWNNTTPFNGSKRSRDSDPKMFSSNFSGLDNPNVENGKRSTGLVHHLSLPKTASEMATAEKFLHFQQDSLQVRAKRGCATHPRSIAERMRRTRISEKLKKLQDLFPNLDKQTNTADMLDMAVEYIKELQNQVQSLTESKAKCVCPNKSREN